jgi:hypothetical protein
MEGLGLHFPTNLYADIDSLYFSAGITLQALLLPSLPALPFRHFLYDEVGDRLHSCGS